jgi:hypothetical protein
LNAAHGASKAARGALDDFLNGIHPSPVLLQVLLFLFSFDLVMDVENLGHWVTWGKPFFRIPFYYSALGDYATG